MKYLSKILLCCLFGFSGLVQGQEAKTFSLKLQTLALLRNGVELVSEWQNNPKSSWELSFRYNYSGSAPQGVFNGTWSNQYVERRTYMVDESTMNLYNDSGVQFLGDGRPMPTISSPLLSFMSGRVSVAYKQYRRLGVKNLEGYLQPAFSVAVAEVFEVVRNDTRFDESLETWRLGESNTSTQMAIRETRYYYQNRETLYRRNWVAGVSYHVGLKYRFARHFILEARAGGGFNLGGMPELDKKLPYDLRHYYGNGQLLVGYIFN